MRKLVILICVGVVMLWGRPVWAQEGQEETIKSLNQRVKELEEIVKQLSAAQASNGASPTPLPAARVQPASMQPAPSQEAGIMQRLENRVKSLEEGTQGLWGIELGGMLYSSYEYNFNRPDSESNSLRIFDNDHNDFNLDLFQLSISKETQSGLGFTAILDFGETAGGIASDWDGDGELSSSEESNDFEVQEAYVSYTIPIGQGLEVKGGKFVTLLGAEVIESPYNYNVSRSFLFGFAIPFTHTGVLFSYPLSDRVSLTAGVVNGWDNVDDNNDGKSFLGGLSLEPMEGVSWSFNGVYGSEQTGLGGSKRGVFDTVLSYTPIEHLEFNFNYDRGTESNILTNGDEALWQGIAGIVSIGGGLFEPSWAPFSLALRGEWFSDEDGARTGTAQDLWELTTTLKWEISEHLEVRLEYRHDDSNKRVFEKKDGIFKGDQNTLATEIALLF